MDKSLTEETEKLTRSWMRHEGAWLRDYLVAGVEDPRLNLQSILSRHFLIRHLAGQRFASLMKEECRFAAILNWATGCVGCAGGPEELQALLYALRRGADNAEGVEIPPFVVTGFGALPMSGDGFQVPNYLESFLAGAELAPGQPAPHEASLQTFEQLWRSLLPGALQEAGSTMSVLEPACGSANDFRSWQAYGLTAGLDYTGFDLCRTNVENAQRLFPGSRFEEGNVFEIAAADESFDVCVVHDLFEHLSLAGLERAVDEICRVTRRGICAGFFQMDERPEHVVRPVEDYHWNLLSMGRMKELFARRGFVAQVIHIGTFLRSEFGCEETHNPQAYTFVLRRGEGDDWG